MTATSAPTPFARVLMRKEDAWFIRVTSPQQRTWLYPVVCSSRQEAEKIHQKDLARMETMALPFAFEVIAFAQVTEVDLEHALEMCRDTTIAAQRSTAEFVLFWENTPAPVEDFAGRMAWRVRAMLETPESAIMRFHQRYAGAVRAAAGATVDPVASAIYGVYDRHIPPHVAIEELRRLVEPAPAQES